MMQLGGAFSHSNEGREHLYNQVKLATYRWVFIEYSHKGRSHYDHLSHFNSPLNKLTTSDRFVRLNISMPIQKTPGYKIFTGSTRTSPVIFPLSFQREAGGELYNALWVIFSQVQDEVCFPPGLLFDIRRTNLSEWRICYKRNTLLYSLVLSSVLGYSLFSTGWILVLKKKF